MAEYRIDELARITGVPVRNIRYYQDNRMLPPPRRVGRVGLYGESHLVRLRLITRLLDRGYTAAAITELVTAWEQGRELSDVLGLEREVSGFWSEEIPAYLTGPELCELFGAPADRAGTVDDDLVERVVHAGLATPDGGSYKLASPRTVHAVAGIVRCGAPVGAVLELCGGLLRNLDDTVRGFVQAVAEHLLRDREPGWLPGPDEIPELAAFARQLRPMATTAITAALNRSMDTCAEDVLGDFIGRVLPHLRQHPA